MATARRQGWRRAFFIGAAAALLLGLAARWRETSRHLGEIPFQDEDSRQYYASALNLRDCGIYSPDPPGPCPLQEPQALRSPLYPAYLRLALGRLSSPEPAWEANLAASVAVMALTGAAGAVFFSPAAGAAAAALAALDPRQNASLRSFDIQAFYSVLILLVALSLLAWARRPRAANAALAGLLIGVSLCARSTLILFPFFWAALIRPRRRQIEKPGLQCSVFLLCCALPVLPWAWRNFLVLGHFRILETQVTKFVVIGGALAQTSKDFTLAALFEHGDPPGTIVLIKNAVLYVLANPFSYFHACLLRLINLWGPWLLAWPVLLWRLSRDSRNLSAWALAALPLYWNIHALIFSHPRHAAPATPLLCLAAALILTRRTAEVQARGSEWTRRLLLAACLPAFALWAGCVFFLAEEASVLPAGAGQAARRLEEARIALNAGRPAEARDSLGFFMGKNPPLYLRATAAHLYQRLGEPARCAEIFEEMTALFPDHASLHNDAAVCSSLAGRPGPALRHAEEAVRLDPSFPAAAMTLAALRKR